MRNLRSKLALVLIFGTITACGASQSVAPGGVPLGAPCLSSDCTQSTGGGAAVVPTFSGGDTETMAVSKAALSTYEGYPLTAPGAVTVNLSLYPYTANVFLGTMNIAFVDNGTTLHNGTFSNGTSTQGYNGYSNTVSTQTSSGVYRIFMEDAAGALVVVINANQIGSDTAATGSATVYFYNFNSTAPNPLYSSYQYPYSSSYAYCWMISQGPYDCMNMNVPPTTAQSGQYTTVPAFGYLGTFPVNIHNALGI